MEKLLQSTTLPAAKSLGDQFNEQLLRVSREHLDFIFFAHWTTVIARTVTYFCAFHN